MRDDETTIKGNLATVIVRNDHGPYPERNRGQLYLELKGPKLTGLDANELRDAIDKAVGPREADKLFRDQERIRELEGIAMRRGDRIDELEAREDEEAERLLILIADRIKETA